MQEQGSHLPCVPSSKHRAKGSQEAVPEAQPCKCQHFQTGNASLNQTWVSLAANVCASTHPARPTAKSWECLEGNYSCFWLNKSTLNLTAKPCHKRWWSPANSNSLAIEFQKLPPNWEASFRWSLSKKIFPHLFGVSSSQEQVNTAPKNSKQKWRTDSPPCLLPQPCLFCIFYIYTKITNLHLRKQ